MQTLAAVDAALFKMAHVLGNALERNHDQIGRVGVIGPDAVVFVGPVKDQVARVQRIDPLIRADVHLPAEDINQFPERVTLARKNISGGKMKMVKAVQLGHFDQWLFLQSQHREPPFANVRQL